MMKNIIEKFQICLVLSALLFSSFVAACSGNDDTVTPEITIPANILTDGMTFSKTGGTSTLNIKSNVALEVTSSAPEWCKVTAESSASSSILKYTVMAEANTDTSDREAKVTVKSRRQRSRELHSETNGCGRINHIQLYLFRPASCGRRCFCGGGNQW